MKILKIIIPFCIYSSAIGSSPTPAQDARDSRDQLFFNPIALASMSRGDVAKKLGIPQRCSSIQEGEYCRIYFGVYFLFNKKNKLTSAIYDHKALARSRKHAFGTQYFHDLVNNGKPVSEEIIRIWTQL